MLANAEAREARLNDRVQLLQDEIDTMQSDLIYWMGSASRWCDLNRRNIGKFEDKIARLKATNLYK